MASNVNRKHKMSCGHVHRRGQEVMESRCTRIDEHQEGTK